MTKGPVEFLSRRLLALRHPRIIVSSIVQGCSVIKVAMIGAGSVVFSKNLTGDILSYPEFRKATLAYMDVDGRRLEVGAKLCRKVARGLGADPRIEATLDRRQALAGADFVINMAQVGGFDSTLVDFEIPRKYGLNFTIADTTGPGGLFRCCGLIRCLAGSAGTWRNCVQERFCSIIPIR